MGMVNSRWVCDLPCTQDPLADDTEGTSVEGDLEGRSVVGEVDGLSSVV